MKPHKHAELIKAWADGAEIEHWFGNEWQETVGSPDWDSYEKYRIKPVKRQYRVAAMFDKEEGRNYVSAACAPGSIRMIEKQPDFVRWLTDLVEYEAHP